MAANKTRVQVRGTTGKSIRIPAAGVTAAQLAAAIAAIPAPVATSSAASSSGGGVSSVGVSTSTLLLGGTNPITSSGTISVDLTAAQVALLATLASLGFVLSAGWNSTSGIPVSTSLAVPQDVMIPYGCTLQQVYIMTQGGTGSCTVTLNTAAFPTTPATDITGGVPPAIASSTSYSNSTLTSWTKTFAQAALIRAALTANTNFTSVKIFMRFK